MKIIKLHFKMPQDAVILELQILCKKLILSSKENFIENLLHLKCKMQEQAFLIALNHSVMEIENIRYKVQSYLTYEVFTVTYNGEIFISLTARKKEFEIAFKDLDSSRNN